MTNTPRVMLVNTTRSATIVFRFSIESLAKFPIKRHTRFAYVARIGLPTLPPRRRQYGLASSDNGWFLLGLPAPLPGRSLRTDLARFSASANDNFGQTVFVIRFSPVAGSVCNLPSQRALHSAGRTHLPLQNAEIIPPSPAPRQLPHPLSRTFAPSKCTNN